MSLESGWDRDSQTKKGGMVGLTGKNERESGIWEGYCGPSAIWAHGNFTSSRDTKIKRTLLENGLGLLVKEYEKNPSYGHTRVHNNMMPWALRALGTKTGTTAIRNLVGRTACLIYSHRKRNSWELPGISCHLRLLAIEVALRLRAPARTVIYWCADQADPNSEKQREDGCCTSIKIYVLLKPRTMITYPDFTLSFTGKASPLSLAARDLGKRFL